MAILIIECKMCHFQYGAWRPQCTACGNKTPDPEPAPRFTPRIRRERAPRPPAKTCCAFCRVRGAKDTCPACGALIHSTCRTLHNVTHA